MFKVRANCVLCKSKSIKEVFSLAPTPIANRLPLTYEQAQREFKHRVPLTLLMCEECKHVQLRELVNPDILFENYPYLSVSNETMKSRLDDLCDEIERNDLQAKSDSILEIGSNDGYLLGRFKSKGYRVLGVDPAQDVAIIANRNGVYTLTSYFKASLIDEIIERVGRPKVIIANNVLAHTDELIEIFQSLAEIMSVDSILYVEVSYLLDVLGKGLIDTIYHEHTSYHHIGPLRKLLSVFGLEIIDAERFAAHGGSIRLKIKKAGAKPSVSSRLNMLIDSENRFMDSESDLWTKLSESAKDLRNLILESALENSEKHAHGIFGYGISAKFATLYFGLNLDVLEIREFFDDNKAKIGRFVPGTTCKIKSSAEMSYTNKTLLLFSWNYKEEVMKNLKSKKHQGNVISPLPEFQVIDL